MKSNTLYHLPLQNRHRHLALIVLAGCSWADVTLAQDPAAPAGTDASSAPSSTVKGTKTTAETPGDTTAGSAPKGNSPFRTGESSRSGGAAKKSPFAYDTGDTETSKTKGTRKTVDVEADAEKPAQSASREASESRIVAPGFYGRGPQVITPGQGQFARPKYRFGVSVGVGYDDNPNQTSSANLGAVAQPRVRSGFTNVNGHFDAQWLKPRTVFTVNLEAGGDFYFDRPGSSTNGNVRLGMLYVNKIDPLTQFTANGSFAYLSQPDYSNLYASTNQNGGDYFTGSTKFDLNHRWAPHFSTTTSASANLLKYANGNAGALSNSYWSFIFGNEFRFQSSPRYTWVAEGRYGFDEYIDNKALNAQTAYVLGGLDWLVTRHLTTTVRAGASIRSFDVGGNNTSPYAEVSVNYVTGRHSTLTLNGRYGFEQSTVAGDENLSYRLGLLYQQAFTARFSGNTGINFVHTDYRPRATASTATDVVDVNFGLQYRLDRHFSLGARYNYTFQNSSTGFQDFDRNRLLFSVQYEY